MGGLAERYPVQRVGAPPGRQGVHHHVGHGADGTVKAGRALDTLGDRHRPRRAQQGARRPSCPLTTNLLHDRDVPSTDHRSPGEERTGEEKSLRS